MKRTSGNHHRLGLHPCACGSGLSKEECKCRNCSHWAFAFSYLSCRECAHMNAAYDSFNPEDEEIVPYDERIHSWEELCDMMHGRGEEEFCLHIYNPEAEMEDFLSEEKDSRLERRRYSHLDRKPGRRERKAAQEKGMALRSKADTEPKKKRNFIDEPWRMQKSRSFADGIARKYSRPQQPCEAECPHCSKFHDYCRCTMEGIRLEVLEADYQDYYPDYYDINAEFADHWREDFDDLDSDTEEDFVEDRWCGDEDYKSIEEVFQERSLHRL